MSNFTPQNIIAGITWEATGPDAMYPEQMPDDKTDFSNLRQVIAAIINDDAEALGATIMKYARPYMIAQLTENDPLHGHDLLTFLKNQGFDLSAFPEPACDDGGGADGYGAEQYLDNRDRAQEAAR